MVENLKALIVSTCAVVGIAGIGISAAWWYKTILTDFWKFNTKLFSSAHNMIWYTYAVLVCMIIDCYDNEISVLCIIVQDVNWGDWMQIRGCEDSLRSQWLIIELCWSGYSGNHIFHHRILCSANDSEESLKPVINMVWYAEK